VNSLDELAFGLGSGVGRASSRAGRRGQRPGICGAIPNVLPFESQGNSGAIGEQATQEPFQELS